MYRYIVMNTDEMILFGEILKNNKRRFIIELLLKKDLKWSELEDNIDKEFKIRVNPNTLSFHLKYLLERGIVKKSGEHYSIDNKYKLVLTEFFSKEVK